MSAASLETEERKIEQINIPVTPAFKRRFLAVAGESPTSFARRAVEKDVEAKERRVGRHHSDAVAQ